MSTNIISLGEYEKQVLLELDNHVTLAQSQWIRAKDPSFRYVFKSIVLYHRLNMDKYQCVRNILYLLDLPTNGCAPVAVEGVAELGYN